MKDFADIRTINGRQVLAMCQWGDEDDTPEMVVTYQHKDETTVSAKMGFPSEDARDKAFAMFRKGAHDEALHRQINETERQFPTEPDEG